MGAGTIIYLNGTSSSGKTSIARALQERLAEPYLHCPVELFEQMIPHRQIERGVIPELMALQRGFTACVAAPRPPHSGPSGHLSCVQSRFWKSSGLRQVS